MSNIDIIKQNYKCPKCGNSNCIIDGMAATGKGMSRLMDVQTNRFTTVSCNKCGYTEFYKDNILGGLTGSDILDVFFGG